jgi:hypothetical protein
MSRETRKEITQKKVPERKYRTPLMLHGTEFADVQKRMYRNSSSAATPRERPGEKDPGSYGALRAPA